MATLILHPTKDISSSGNADPNSGSTKYGVVGSNDGDSTYVRMRINNANTVTNKFTVGFTGNFNTTVKISSIRVGVVARSQSTSSKDTKNIHWNLIANGITGSSGSSSLASSYTSYGGTYNASTYGLTGIYNNIDSLNIQVEVTIDGKQESSKTDAFDNYVTEVYIEITYSEVTAYNCNAVGGIGISNTAVSTALVEAGGNCTFTATVAQYYTFDGWYTAASGGTKVSSSNPYTMAINSDTTLYARSTAILYSASVGAQPAYGSASVSSGANAYGASVTFTCNVTSSNKEFWGWYSDANHTQLVNESSTYIVTQPASTLVLYPYIGDVRHYVTITCSHAMDVKPFRFNGTGDYNNGKRGESRSLIRNQNNIIGRTELNSGIFAQQSNYKYDSDFNFGISFHFVNGADSLPDNANIVGVTGHIGLATTAGTQYKNMSLFAGEMDYIEYNNSTLTSGQPDETAIINRRGSAKTLTINAIPTDYVLTFEQMGTWTPNEIKNGRCGIELDFTHSDKQSDINIYLAKIEVVYTYNYTSYTCTAESNENCDVFVMDSTLSNPKYYDTDLVVTSGNQCTWFARPVGGYRFDGWYSDSSYNNLVSSTPTYTTTVTANKTLYAKTHYFSRVVSRELTVDFGKGDDYYQGYYSNDGTTRTATNAGSNGFQVNMDMTTGIYVFTGLDVTASLGSTNGKEYIYGLLNDAAKNVLFPNTTAHPVAMDWYNEAGRGAATIAKILGAEIVPKNPLTENETASLVVGNEYVCHQRPSLIAGVSCTLTNLRDDYILNMTKSTDLGYKFKMTNASRSKAIGVNTSIYRLYFEEYDFSAQIHQSAKGVEAVAVSRTIGYEGDSVAFTATLLPGVTFDGWYDGNGTKVSSDVTYTCIPNANLTLYAKASTTLNVYSVSATADTHVSSVSCDHIVMTDGNPVTFTATIDEPGWEFDGWYFNGERVSPNNPYSHIITTNTTLVAKAKQINYVISIGGCSHATGSVSATTAHYGDTVTFTLTPDPGYAFDGWYIDSGYITRLSVSNPYTHTVKGDVTLYGNTTHIQYQINVGESEDGVATVSANTAYYGDEAIFTFAPNEGVGGNYGWYLNPELTQIVSKNNPYTHVVTGSITLYPGIVSPDGTGFFIKQQGVQREAMKVWKKVNGVYVEQTDMQSVSSYLQNNNIRSVF